MPELRRDPINNRWVVIAANRGKRPNTLDEKTETPGVEPPCPFCPGNEDASTPEVFALGEPGRQPNGPGWEVRVIPNRYPIFQEQAASNRRGFGLFDYIEGFGVHELVVETPQHRACLAELPVAGIHNILLAYRDRLLFHRENPHLRYVLIFRNYKPEAGASMKHPHSQIIGTPITPLLVKNKLDNYRKYYLDKERCLLCDLIWQETHSPVRIVSENEEYVLLCPFASCFPFETWLCPKTHRHDFAQLTETELVGVAKALKEMVWRIKLALDDPPYNFILNTAPIMRTRPGRPEYWQTMEFDFHWYIELIPRLTKIAGFEWGSGLYVNPVDPEQAAARLRQIQLPDNLEG